MCYLEKWVEPPEQSLDGDVGSYVPRQVVIVGRVNN